MSTHRPGKKMHYPQGRANRRLQAQAFVMPPLVALGLTLAGAALLSYLWLRNTTEAVGRKIKLLEQDRILLAEEISIQTAAWNELTSPQGLENALRRFELRMTHAHGQQAVTVRNRDVWLDRRPSPVARDLEARLP
jgi:hypothetical protein